MDKRIKCLKGRIALTEVIIELCHEAGWSDIEEILDERIQHLNFKINELEEKDAEFI